MNTGFSIYSAIFLIATIASFFVAYLAWQRRSVKGAKELALLMIASGIWTFWIIFETAAQTMHWKVFWSKLEYIGAVTSPILLLIFVFRFVGKDKYITKKNILLLFLVPVITLLLTFTNEKHLLVWSGYSEISAHTNIMEYYHGIWFWVGYLAYNYLLLILSTIYILVFIVKRDKTFSLQGWLLLFASLCPWTASALYLAGWNVVPGLDLTPLSIVLSSMLLAYSIFYSRFLDLIPVARETLVETMSDGILVLDNLDRIQDINPAAMIFLGILNRDVLGIHVASCGAKVGHLLNAVTVQDQVAQIDVMFGGEERNYRLIKKPVKSQAGSRLIVIHDITDQVIHQKAILSVEKRYQQMFASNPEPMWIYDLETLDFLEVNQAAIVLYGYSREEFMKLTLRELCAVLPVNLPNQDNSYCIGSECTHLKKSGEEIIVEVISNTIAYGGHKGCHALMLNITERKKAEMEVKLKNEQLTKAFAEKDRIFSIIAHDLRGPFSAFLGLTEILSEDLPSLTMTEIHSFAQSMKNSATNVFYLLENLLNWARSQQGLITFSRERIYLLQVLEESTSIIENVAKNKEIQIKHVFPDNLEIFADRLAIQTVIRNLVSNAVKFTPKGGEVYVKANSEPDNNIVISVKDNGIGMNLETRENLFRIDIPTNRSGTNGEPSSGLGLLLCKELIEKQGGMIWVESEVGKGSEFYFSIPLNIDVISENR
ncbi:MAG: ATP-binding protein [Prolixibacteraceae bacterium]|jgi:PAS domain S-box-containing protein|nr:ATP-binding protein [Prolixibacteraceae bacterium]